MKVRYSYLPQQFADPEEILRDIRNHLKTCNFTLGPEVEQFERSFAGLIGTRHGIGVGSGTDSLTLSLRALGIGRGDEVITAANTFIATIGAINAVGAVPVLVDVTSYFTIDPALVEAAISPRTKAIMPVHLTGEPVDMTPVMELAGKYKLAVVEDACQAIGATICGKTVGTFGEAAGFSLHPLKNLNVWGDAGIVVTNSDSINDKIRLLRNHGLRSRDEVEILGYNSRLDSIQAIVGNWLIQRARGITEKRIANATFFDNALAGIPEIQIPPRRANARRVFHLYILEVQKRDELYRYLNEQGIEAKIHYPIPLHLQKGLAHLGYKAGDFPISERHATNTITLPVDQHLSEEEMAYVAETIRRFYRKP